MKSLLVIHEVEDKLDDLKKRIKLAQHAGAHLNIVVLGAIRVVPMTAAPGVPDFYYSEYNKELIDAGRARVKQIDTLVAAENVSATVTLECRDPALVEQTCQHHAMFSDASLFPTGAVLDKDLMTRAFNGALLESGAPVLMLGQDAETLPDVSTILYAWNGEPQAAKAIHESLRWINGKAKAHIVLIDPDENVMGPNPGDNMAAFMARQGLDVIVERLPGGARDVSEVLLEHATDIGADLLVMGAYGHSRLREWLLGGTTRNILQQAQLPVLMCH
ncbi:MAG: universal stress protein [Rhizobiaceae bacterium]|nr:universal stress protein [Rhizobiaceae bacterium]